VQIAQWGVFVTTPEVSSDQATIAVRMTLENRGTTESTLSITTSLHELDSRGGKTGAALATLTTDGVRISPNASQTATSAIVIPRPNLWSIDHPHLCVAVTTLKQDGAVVDEVETPFGIRTIEFTATNGFLLNGQHVPLRGVCNHHDLGALGAAFNVRAAERQLEILKAMGCNALRTAHNPPAPELLDLCDRMGFVVMDEAFDCWKGKKKRNDYHLLFPAMPWRIAASASCWR
jgi:beta-galactosidase